MKRLFPAALLALSCLLFTGCARLISNEYLVVTPHSEQTAAPIRTDAVEVQNYRELKSTIRQFVLDGVEQGVIHAAQYDTQVEEDINTAVYEVSREDPVGAYAIDYITHDCSQIISYYEINLHISYRDMATPLDRIEHIVSASEMRRAIEKAMQEYADHLTVYADFSTELDYEQIAADYYEQNPAAQMALPEVSSARFPDNDLNGILEVSFHYPEEKDLLLDKKQALADDLRAATVYVRYSQSDYEKAGLLLTYLAERFHYRQGRTSTPVFSALCEGVADSKSMTQVWQLLCDACEIPCVTVEGFYGGESWCWNIVQLDGEYCHLDILRDLLEEEELHLRYDEEMVSDYYWDASVCPACPLPESALQEQTPVPEEEEEPTKPEQSEPEQEPE